jgi:hypothetical protein
MERISIEEYGLTLINDLNYSVNSSDNMYTYDYEYYGEDCDKNRIVSRHGIISSIDEGKSAILLASGGGTGIHESCYVLDGRNLIICVSDSLFCLKVPELSLNWKVKADSVTSFEVIKFWDGYIVHGELEISYINLNGIKEWEFSGRDIFTTLDGKDTFLIKDNYIVVKDWLGYKYKIDRYGKEII